ncbi:uncharacterized protein HaLaN_12585, partial [Haematococcus lacustris]
MAMILSNSRMISSHAKQTCLATSVDRTSASPGPRAGKAQCGPTSRWPLCKPASVRIAVRLAKCNSYSSSSPSGSTNSSRSDSALAELRALEAERDTAITAAEACSKTGTKLAEMARLLQQLALEKVRNHDEEGARQVLVEKAGVMEALEKGAVKAEANYTLARKLASKIADKQAALLNK